MNQPPYAEYPRPGSNPLFGRGPGVYFESIGEAWNLVLKDLGHWIAATLVYLVTGWALSLPINLLTVGMAPVTPRPDEMAQFFSVLGLRMALSLIPAIIQGVMLVGMITMGVRKARGEYINVGMMFEPFRRFGTILGASALYYLIVFASALAFILPVLFFGPVLVLLPTVAYLRQVSPIEALGLTFDACKGYWASLLALMIVVGLIQIAGVCACGVGLLVAWPIYCVVLGIHYRAFFESEVPPMVDVYR